MAARLGLAVKEKLADMETPVVSYLKLCRSRPDSFLLETVEPHETVGRYSIIAFDPLWALELWPDRALVLSGGREESRPAGRFFELIKEALASLTCPPRPDLPAVGSLMGYVGYDAVRLIERLQPAPEISVPAARLVFPSRFVLFDHLRRVMTLSAIAPDQEAAEAKLEEMAAAAGPPPEPGSAPVPFEVTPPPRERFLEAVRRAKEHIVAGDIFQVVLADRFQGRGEIDPLQVYRLLRVRSPSPYMFFLNFGRFHIVGASPETLVKVRDGSVFLRPIAGTSPRSADPAEDLRLEKEMLASDKERAEHVMLVDLARNDAGRVCRYGSVAVSPFMAVERFSHVMHIVSGVQGRLEEGSDVVDAFRAGFPAGTVSGAPKVRAMEIIDDLEAVPRGPYSGAVGYFGPGQEMDTCIAIRMILFEEDGFSVPVGAGIVADSDPAREYQELQHKAAQSLSAIKQAAEGER